MARFFMDTYTETFEVFKLQKFIVNSPILFCTCEQ